MSQRRVFISSTLSDLEDYRVAAEGAVLEAGLQPVRSERFAAEGRPPLETCLKEAEKCDVAIVIVAHRYGWIPEERLAKDERSITWSECQVFRDQKKEVLPFLIHPEKDDWPISRHDCHRFVSGGDNLADIQRDIDKLKEFKAWLDQHYHRNRFTSEENFQRKVVNALHKWRERQGQAIQTSVEASVAPEYLDWLMRNYGRVEMQGHDRQTTAKPVQLRQVYVPLTVTGGDALGKEVSPEAESREAARRGERPEPTLLLDLVAKKNLAVSGAPGSGKTTFCRWVAIRAAGGPEMAQPVRPPDEYLEEWPEELDARLPVLIPLRDFWKTLPPDQHELSRKELETCLKTWAESKGADGLSWQGLQAHLRQGSALMILDGFDEVPYAEKKGRRDWSPRQLLLTGLRDAIEVWSGEGNRILVTSRPYGLEAGEIGTLGLSSAVLGDLPEELQRQLVHCWFDLLEQGQEAVPRPPEELAEKMLSEVRVRAGLSDLTANPLLLTAMCIVFNEGHRLPEDKHELYGRIVSRVLHNRVPGKRIEPLRQRLAAVAHGMHTGSALREKRSSPRAEATYDELDRILEAYMSENIETDQGFEEVNQTRETLLSDSGLLLPKGTRTAEFYHLSIQEYLAAQRIFALRREGFVKIFRRYGEIPQWANTLSFLFAEVLSQPSPEGGRLLKKLIEEVSSDEVGTLAVIGDCQEILANRGRSLPGDLTDTWVRKLLAAVESGDGRLDQRLRVGLVLGRVGDPRVIADLRGHDSEQAWVRIPAGVYTVGDGGSAREFTMEHDLMMSRYPVTNSQFRVFVEDEGYQKPELWEDEQGEGVEWLKKNKEEGRGGTSAASEHRFGGDTQPVVGITFWEARAFARWAGGRLPSEWEWEAAARGPSSLHFPWGGQDEWKAGICNSAEAGLGHTSPVGLFPRSRSRDFGLEDMAGNVWEWCDSFYDEDKAFRVVRGGSWNNDSRFIRCSYRVNDHPDDRFLDIGFRMCM